MLLCTNVLYTRVTLYKCPVHTTMWVGIFLRIDTGVILIGDAIQANQCLVLVEIKRCQVRDWIVGKEVVEFHKLYIVLVWTKAN